jgi:hypothetical protein
VNMPIIHFSVEWFAVLHQQLHHDDDEGDGRVQIPDVHVVRWAICRCSAA